MNPTILKTKLDSFLTPSERFEGQISYSRTIRERFDIENDRDKNLGRLEINIEKRSIQNA
jgi:hypothetical protein